MNSEQAVHSYFGGKASTGSDACSNDNEQSVVISCSSAQGDTPVSETRDTEHVLSDTPGKVSDLRRMSSDEAFRMFLQNE